MTSLHGLDLGFQGIKLFLQAGFLPLLLPLVQLSPVQVKLQGVDLSLELYLVDLSLVQIELQGVDLFLQGGVDLYTHTAAV